MADERRELEACQKMMTALDTVKKKRKAADDDLWKEVHNRNGTLSETKLDGGAYSLLRISLRERSFLPAWGRYARDGKESSLA